MANIKHGCMKKTYGYLLLCSHRHIHTIERNRNGERERESRILEVRYSAGMDNADPKNDGLLQKVPVSCARHTCEEVKKNLEAPKAIKALSNLPSRSTKTC